MAIYRFGESCPQIAGAAFVAKEATLIGQVAMGAGSSMWFGAVARADNAPIHIGAASNIQEGAVLHTDPGFPLHIGDNVTVGHQAMLHGCTIGEGVLIGIQAVVLNGAVIGKNCLVGAGAVVTERKTFPEGSLIVGAPAKVMRALTDAEIAGLGQSARNYSERARQYSAELEQVE